MAIPCETISIKAATDRDEAACPICRSACGTTRVAEATGRAVGAAGIMVRVGELGEPYRCAARSGPTPARRPDRCGSMFLRWYSRCWTWVSRSAASRSPCRPGRLPGCVPRAAGWRGLIPALSAQLDRKHPHALLDIDNTADRRLNRAVQVAGYLFCVEVAPTDRSSLIKLRVDDNQLVAAVIGDTDWANEIDRSDGMAMLAAWEHSRDRVAASDGAVNLERNESGMTVTAVIPLDPPAVANRPWPPTALPACPAPTANDRQRRRRRNDRSGPRTRASSNENRSRPRRQTRGWLSVP